MKLMVIRLVTLLVGLVVGLSSPVMAYELGEGSIESAYQQPLRMKFELIKEQVLFDSELSVELASEESFASQNLEYLSYFDELVFRVEGSDSGPRYLIIDSANSLPDDEISLLVRLSWKQSSVLSRIDVIVTSDFSAVLSIHLDEKGNMSVYQVSSGDTLWRIAKVMRPQNASVWQMVDAIYVNNPGAFLLQDPGKLIIGSMLRKPEEQSIYGQTGTLVSLIMEEMAVNKIETSATGQVADNEEVSLAKDSVKSDSVLFSENTTIPYFDATDIKPSTESIEATIIAEDSVDIQPEVIAEDVVDTKSNDTAEGSIDVKSSVKVDTNSLPSNSTNVELQRLNTALMEAQDNIMAAQMEASALRAKIEQLQSQIAMLDQQLVDEQQEKLSALEVAEQLRTQRAEQGNDDMVWVAVTMIAVLMLGGVVIYVVRARRSDLEERSAASTGVSDRLADHAEDIFADMKADTSDVFADTKQETPFPGAEGLEQLSGSELSSMDDMDYLDQSDNINPVDVKLDLAQTYADLGDISGAVEILEEIIGESNKEGRARAQAVLDKLQSDS